MFCLIAILTMLNPSEFPGDRWQGDRNGGHKETVSRCSTYLNQNIFHLDRKLKTGDLILGEKPVMTMPVSVFDSDSDATEEWLDRVSPLKRMILTTGFLCKIIFCHPLIGRW